ncbi:GerAB/ArcD/ProY family transporter [Pueribacillus sp. YX66]|uniref:GerAB/ArcD/ProY family transporter n=1 Tax=Pueribacillus sp. YX66 TaxID=3229242 RepID=UPI00358D8F9B
MIKLNDGKVGVKEFTTLIIFMIGIKFKDATPDLLYEVGKNAAWMIPLFSLLFFIVPFLMLLALLKKHQKGFVELIIKLTGNVIGTIIVSFLFVLFFSSTIVNFRSHTEIVNTLFYQKTPFPVLFFLIVTASFFIAKRGFETIGRTAWLVFPYLVVLMVFLVIFTWRQINWEFFFPIEGPGIMTVMKESVKYSSIIGEVIILTAFYPFLRNDKAFRKSSYVGVIFSCVQLSFFLALLVLVFDYPGVAHMNFPYQQLTRYVTIGQTVSHIEGLFLGFWSMVTAIHFALYLFLSSFLLAGFLRLKENFRLMLPLAGLVFLIGLFPENIFTLTHYRKVIVVCGSWFAFFLPILLWVIDKWKGRIQ